MARFAPGQSGNPGGRPKVDPEVMELARQATPRAIGRLVELIESRDGRVAIAASNSVLDRVFGKPTQPIAGDEDHAPIAFAPSPDMLAKVNPDDRAALRAIIARAFVQSEGDTSSA